MYPPLTTASTNPSPEAKPTEARNIDNPTSRNIRLALRWFQKLDTLPLSEQEKIFCTISLIYSHLTDVEIAEYMCYAKESIRIIKHRLLKKIGISNAEFSDFLHNLSIDG